MSTITHARERRLAMNVEIKHCTPHDVHAICGPVLVRIVDGAGTETADIDRIHDLFLSMLAHQPNIGMLLVAHHGNPSPSLATMRYSAQMLEHLQHRVVLGVALLGLGFWAESSRTAVSWLMRLLGNNSIVVAQSAEAAIEGMALDLVGLDVAGLAAAVADLERRFRTLGHD